MNNIIQLLNVQDCWDVICSFLTIHDCISCATVSKNLKEYVYDRKSIVSLELPRTHVNDDVVRGKLTDFIQIQRLCIVDWDVHNEECLSALLPLRHLRTLELCHNAFRPDEALKALLLMNGLPSVQKLRLGIAGLRRPSTGYLNGVCMDYVASLRTLTDLDLSEGFKLTNHDLKCVENLRLERLVIRNCQRITDLSFLSSMTTLRILDVSRTLVGDTLVTLCAELQELYMDMTPFMTEVTLRSVVAHFQKLSVLSLSGCAEVTDTVCEDLSHLCHLRVLQLANCRRITDSGVHRLMKRGLRLDCLGLRGLVNVTDEGIMKLAHGLKRVDFSRCRITDEGVTHMAKCCGSLEALSLSYCHEVTNTSISKLGEFLHQLKLLNVDNTSITDGALDGLPSSLRILDISACDVTDMAMHNIRHIRLRTLSVCSCSITDNGIKWLDVQDELEIVSLEFSTSRLTEESDRWLDKMKQRYVHVFGRPMVVLRDSRYSPSPLRVPLDGPDYDFRFRLNIRSLPDMV